jgi:hypothetical protein
VAIQFRSSCSLWIKYHDPQMIGGSGISPDFIQVSRSHQSVLQLPSHRSRPRIATERSVWHVRYSSHRSLMCCRGTVQLISVGTVTVPELLDVAKNVCGKTKMVQVRDAFRRHHRVAGLGRWPVYPDDQVVFYPCSLTVFRFGAAYCGVLLWNTFARQH